MLLRQISLTRFNAFRYEIKRLLESEFPCKNTKQLLELIDKNSEELLGMLGNITDKDVLEDFSRVSLNYIVKTLPILGFILRSTKDRNAFEVYNPILELAHKLLKPYIKDIDVKEITFLVLSSEWEYMPLIRTEILKVKGAPKLIRLFIGFPASDSRNTLLIPAAGHELGHALWELSKLRNTPQNSESEHPLLGKHFVMTICEVVQEKPNLNPTGIEPSKLLDEWVQNPKIMEKFGHAIDYAKNQIQETFCDFVGLKIFKESYIKTFAYILAPGFESPERSTKYPPLNTRRTNVIHAAVYYGVDVPEGFENLFADFSEIVSTEELAKQRELADLVLQRYLHRLLDYAEMCVDQADIEPINSSIIPKDVDLGIRENKLAERRRQAQLREEKILNDFFNKVPASDCISLADIINAAWRAYERKNIWTSIINEEERLALLNNLVMKTIEVLDLEKRLFPSIPHKLGSAKFAIVPSISEPEFDEIESGQTSVNLRLGSWFITPRKGRLPFLGIDRTREHERHQSQLEAKISQLYYIPIGESFFLHPRSFLLGTTLEWLKIPEELRGYVVGKTSWGRRGLIIATTSGLQPGFYGCLTVEICNIGEVPIEIMPGTKICRMFFHKGYKKPRPAPQTGSNELFDRTHFLGRIKPTIGRIELDPDLQRILSALSD